METKPPIPTEQSFKLAASPQKEKFHDAEGPW